MKATQARQLKHYFHLDHFELKTLWICLLKYRKHFLLLYDFAINDNQMLATNQSYCFYHKVSYSGLVSWNASTATNTNRTELLCESLSSFSVSGNLLGSGKLSLLYYKAKYRILEHITITNSALNSNISWLPKNNNHSQRMSIKSLIVINIRSRMFWV